MPGTIQQRCLMIEMPDRRRFFTGKDSLNGLLEFSRAFGARISMVDAVQAQCLSLDELAVAVCDRSFRCQGKVLAAEPVLPREIIFTAARPDSRCRRTTLALARAIRGFIRTSLTSRETVSLQMLRERYQEHRLGLPCLCTHLSRVRREMEAEGFKVTKIGPGRYRLAD